LARKSFFGKPIGCHGFLRRHPERSRHQLCRISRAIDQGAIPSLTVNKGRKEWRERFNHDVGSYFFGHVSRAQELLGSKVQWRVEKMGVANLPDPLFRYLKFFEWERTNRKDKPKPVASIAKQAVQIKFEVALVEKSGDKEDVIGKTQLLLELQAAVDWPVACGRHAPAQEKDRSAAPRCRADW